MSSDLQKRPFRIHIVLSIPSISEDFVYLVFDSQNKLYVCPVQSHSISHQYMLQIARFRCPVSQWQKKTPRLCQTAWHFLHLLTCYSLMKTPHKQKLSKNRLLENMFCMVALEKGIQIQIKLTNKSALKFLPEPHFCESPYLGPPV